MSCVVFCVYVVLRVSVRACVYVRERGERERDKCVCARQRHTERGRQRHTERGRQRQTDRRTDRQKRKKVRKEKGGGGGDSQ